MVMNILRSRKFAKRVLLVLLILIIPAFVLWGVGSITRKAPLVGQIGRQKVRLGDLAKSAQGVKAQLLLSYYNDSNTLNRLLQNRPLINHIAWERLIFYNAAREKRIKVSNNSVMAFISRHPLFQRNGVFDVQVYNYILRNVMSMEPPQFEKLIKENLQITQFRQSLLRDTSVSDEELLEFYKITNDKIELSYILIDRNLFADKVNVLPEEVEIYYEENKDKLLSPAKVDVEYIEIPYENTSQRDSAIEKLEKIYPELRKAGQKFKETAQKHGLSYERTGVFSREELVPGIKESGQIHDAAFSLKKGETSSPILSGPEKGSIYVLRKIEHIDSAPLKFEEVKEKIREALLTAKSLQLAAEKGNQLYEKMTEEGMTLEEAGKISGQVVETAQGIGSNDYIENVGPAGTIVTQALKTGEGKAVPPLTFMEKGVLLVRVDKIIPADEKDFEEKKDELYQKLLSGKQIRAMDRWFQENAHKIKLKRSLNEL
ncbi:MAG: peptidylprolyl isomerase [Candidatus Omnitrophota bacterium]